MLFNSIDFAIFLPVVFALYWSLNAYKLDLGTRRAKNARLYFIDSLGVTADIMVESMGKTRPVAPNSTIEGKDNPEGRQKNRRVNFILQSESASDENPENEN